MMIGRLSFAILLTALSSVVTAQDGSSNATIPTTKMPTYSPTGSLSPSTTPYPTYYPTLTRKLCLEMCVWYYDMSIKGYPLTLSSFF